MLKFIKNKPKKQISLKEHYNRRNKILIKRRCGGFGDILMQRMIFQDFSQAFPEIELTYTCPNNYIEMAKNHPYANTIDLEKINEEEYGAVYDITTACRVHEIKHGPNNTKHRSDIWANFCGIQLTTHEMYLCPQKEIIEICKQNLKIINPNNLPTILLATKSTNDDFGKSKSLTDNQIKEIVEKLKLNYFIFTIHNEKQEIYNKLNITQFTSLKIQEWIAMTHLADYIISIDTSTFHLAGGLKKPLIGIFSFTDGKIYGKYYDFILVQKEMTCGPCFNLSSCPKTQNSPKPCLTELTADDILQGFYKALEKFPLENHQTNKRISLPVHKT